MTKKNQTFYTIISFSSPRFIKDSYNIIASSHYFVNGHALPIFSQGFADKLDIVYDNKLRIIIIGDDVTEIKINKIGNSISNDYIAISYPEKFFFTEKNIREVYIKNKNIHQFIFLFKNRDYFGIVANLALFNIIISGGSNTKKHILSPIQLRLSRFLIAFLSITGKSVVNSFHNKRKEGQAKVDWTSKTGKLLISELIEKIDKIEEENTNNKSPENTNNESPEKTHSCGYLRDKDYTE
jgi:hypothetical protein